MKAKLLLCCLLLVAVFPNGIRADETHAEQIAFLSQRSGKWEAYLMDDDGANQQRLANRVEANSLVWSPDGSTLAFVRSEGELTQIYLMDADGSNQRRLSEESTGSFAPTWSPDGKQIAYVTPSENDEPTHPIHVYDFATHKDRVLTDYGRWNAPSWSPSGNYLALQIVTRSHGGGGAYTDIYRIDKDGASFQPLTQDQIFAREPQWSPDGKYIAYVSSSDALVMMNTDGNGKRQLANRWSYWFASDIHWSPDSQSIAFVIATKLDQQSPHEQYDVYSAEVSTGTLRNLTNGVGQNMMPAWSLDGSRIAFVSQREDQPDQIYMMNADGTDLRQITDSAGGNDYPAWRPAPKN